MNTHLSFQVTQLRRSYSFYIQRQLVPYGLTHGIFIYLVYVGQVPGCKPSELSQTLHQDNGHITRCLNRLEALGYLERHRSEQDHRAFVLRLTDSGQEVFEKMKTLNIQWEQQVTADLSDEEQSQLSGLLQRVLCRAEEPLQ